MALSLHHQLRQRAFLAYGRFARGMTLGVRAMLVKNDAVVLVKHSYIPGWYFPGGGVEVGESVADAVQREVREETGSMLTAPPSLFGIYRNAHADPRDHVAFFVCRDFEQVAPLRLPNHEIIACDTFPVDGLPSGLSPGTGARIREVLGGMPPAADW